MLIYIVSRTFHKINNYSYRTNQLTIYLGKAASYSYPATYYMYMCTCNSTILLVALWGLSIQLMNKGYGRPLDHNSLQLHPTMSRISLLLHQSEAKPRTSVNNNFILQVQWDITCLYRKGLVYYPNQCFFCGITGNGFQL